VQGKPPLLDKIPRLRDRLVLKALWNPEAQNTPWSEKFIPAFLHGGDFPFPLFLSSSCRLFLSSLFGASQTGR
jgi:hypothetical protein